MTISSHDETTRTGDVPKNRLPTEGERAVQGKNGSPANGSPTNGKRMNGAATGKPAPPKRSMADVYAGLLGKTVTVATAEHLEDAPVGRRLHAGTYRAKVIALGSDHLVLATEWVHGGRSAGSEPMKQFVPLTTVKRVSALKSELILHL